MYKSDGESDKTLISLPAEPLWDQFQIVVCCTEDFQVMKFSYVCWDPFKVQFIGVQVQLLQGGQFVQRALTDKIDIIDLCGTAV